MIEKLRISYMNNSKVGDLIFPSAVKYTYDFIFYQSPKIYTFEQKKAPILRSELIFFMSTEIPITKSWKLHYKPIPKVHGLPL